MSPGIILLAVLCVMLLFSVTIAVLALIAEWVEDRRRRREPPAEHQERMAASNGRPHSEAITGIATRRRP